MDTSTKLQKNIESTEKLSKTALIMVEKINNIAVQNNEDNALATKLLQDNKSLQKQVHDAFDPICDKAHKAWKEAVAQRDKFLTPLTAAEKNIKTKISAFIMERQRIEQEAQRKLDEARKKEEEKQRAALEAKAQKAEKKGDAEKAEELRQKKEEVFIPAAMVESTVEKVKGQSARMAYDFRIVNINAIPRKFLVPDEKKIRQMITTFGKDADIPGVEIFSKVIVSITKEARNERK